MSTKKTIKFCIMVLVMITLGSCCHRDKRILEPVDNVESYLIKEDEDTTTIIEKKINSCQVLLHFYRVHNQFFTSDYGGHKELLLSTKQMLDTVYYGDVFRRHRIQIKQENENLFSTSIYHIDVRPVLILTIYYNRSYKITAIRNWLVYTTYK